MRKYLVFIGSFLILLVLLQYLSGFLLTYLYTPAIDEAWNMSGSLASETIITGSSPWVMMAVAMISATIAFFIAKLVTTKHYID